MSEQQDGQKLSSMVDFMDRGFAYPKLTEWLDWCMGKEKDCFVALPMIQRGSVWKPGQTLTLWDSLLRGMPVGSLMLGQLHSTFKGESVKVRQFGTKALIDVPEGGGLALIDGQQRTLAMLLGWSSSPSISERTIWVDFADKPADGNLFRMHVTTPSLKHGFTKHDPNQRLSLSERKLAVKELGDKEHPWDSLYPVRLNWLIELYGLHGDRQSWADKVKKSLPEKPHRKKSPARSELASFVDSQVDKFYSCLEGLMAQRIPLIRIPDQYFLDEGDEAGNDPALAILFKRVGTGGTPLSNEDYAYSIIKHQLPQTFRLVEEIGTAAKTWQLGATDIVMTAVRLVAAELGLPDYAKPGKPEFDRLRKQPAFLTTFLELIDGGRLSGALKALADGIQYRGNGDIGLPVHAFILVAKPALQVVLRWLLHQQQARGAPSAIFTELVEQSRDELIRFVLYTHLAIVEKELASVWAYTWLKDEQSGRCDVFPGDTIVKHLIKKGQDSRKEIAFPLPSLAEFKRLALSGSLNNTRPVRGWERFVSGTQGGQGEETAAPTRAMEVFRRWWGQNGYRHPLLLWLQRDYVDRLGKGDEEVRLEDETPYDYDHIVPANHWSNWTGIRSSDRLIDFLENPKNGGHYLLGNAIGNLRVWYASDNRSDGDKSAEEKLDPSDSEYHLSLLRDSAISQNNYISWKLCSAKGSELAWDAQRSREFQTAIEQRTFDLYENYIRDLGFLSASWFPEIAIVS